MTQIAVIALDLLAIVLLTFGLYFLRQHRKDLVVAFSASTSGCPAGGRFLPIGRGISDVSSVTSVRR